MEDARDGDLRVPLISSLFFVLVIIGGIFLTFYVFLPSISQPWFPIVAFLLIGSPWAFWTLTYLYTCFKGTCCPREEVIAPYPYGYDPQSFSRRGGGHGGHNVHPMTATTAPPQINAISSHDHRPPLPKDRPQKPPPGTTAAADGGGRRVHFGEVVVVESDGSKVVHEMDSWTNSSKFEEMPMPKPMPPTASRSS